MEEANATNNKINTTRVQYEIDKQQKKERRRRRGIKAVETSKRRLALKVKSYALNYKRNTMS